MPREILEISVKMLLKEREFIELTSGPVQWIELWPEIYFSDLPNRHRLVNYLVRYKIYPNEKYYLMNTIF
jgi:hypothetical protein